MGAPRGAVLHCGQVDDDRRSGAAFCVRGNEERTGNPAERREILLLRLGWHCPVALIWVTPLGTGRYNQGMSDRGEHIRSARLAAGLSQAELARRAGTSQPAVNRYEQGRTVPTVGTTERLISACQARMRPSELLANNRERVRRLAGAHGALRVLVFGSVARGEDDAESDLDLLVEIPAERLRLLDLIELGHEVSDALGVEVDIATPDMLKPSIREEVLAEARPL